MLSQSSYSLYVAFMAILFALASQLHPHLAAGSLKWLRTAVALFVINFVAVWWALQQTTHRPVVHCHSVIFHIIIYTSMILAPGFLLYVLVLQQLGWLLSFGSIQDMFTGVYNLLFGRSTPAGSPSAEPVASTAASYVVETESLASFGGPHTDIENDCPQIRPPIATHQSAETESWAASGHPNTGIEKKISPTMAPIATQQSAETESWVTSIQSSQYG